MILYSKNKICGAKASSNTFQADQIFQGQIQLTGANANGNNAPVSGDLGIINFN